VSARQRIGLRRSLLAAALLACITGPVAAQNTPAPLPTSTRPIRLVVPFGPGTSTDIVARAFGDELSKVLGQAVVVHNRAGAGATVATVATAVVAATSPVQGLRDLKAEMARPGGATYASAGNGTSGHLAGALLEARLGGQAVQVSCKEGGQALTEVMGGPCR